METPPNNPTRAVRPNCFVVQAVPAPVGQRVKRKNMARLEREAARRKWLLISGALGAALVLGILIGRFLLP